MFPNQGIKHSGETEVTINGEVEFVPTFGNNFILLKYVI